MTRPDLAITFHVEPADRGVGIMSEGFSAWEPSAACWCDVEDCAQPMRFAWYATETGLPCNPPANRAIVEACLEGFVNAYYAPEAP